MENQIFRGKKIGNPQYSDGTTGDALTGFGKTFVKSGELHGYGYVKAGTTGRFGKKVSGGAYENLRKALENSDIEGMILASKRLPTVTVTIDLLISHPNRGGIRVSRKGCLLFEAQVFN